MTTLRRVRRERPARLGLCGCWNAINPPTPIDLRRDLVHGTQGHGHHGVVVHAWCALCSPGSVPVIEWLLGPESKATGRAQ